MAIISKNEEGEATEFLLICPLCVYLPRKTMRDKKLSINMNTYRNLDWRVNSQVKKLIKEQLKRQLEGVKLATPVTIEFKVFKGTRHKMDKSNVYGAMTKYVYDAITAYGCWEDDNDEFIKDEWIKPTEYDKMYPRCEILIKSIEGGE